MVHRLVVDLEVPNTVWLGMAVRGPPPSPLGGRRIVQVVDPVQRVLDRFGVRGRGGQDDHRLGVQLAAELHELVRAEPVVIRVPSPDDVRVVLSRHLRADAIPPLVRRRERAAGPADEGGPEVSEGLHEIGAQHSVPTGGGPHHREEVQQDGAVTLGDDLDRRLGVGDWACEGVADLLPVRTGGLERRGCQGLAAGASQHETHLHRSPLAFEPRRPVVGVALLARRSVPGERPLCRRRPRVAGSCRRSGTSPQRSRRCPSRRRAASRSGSPCLRSHGPGSARQRGRRRPSG